jgi:SNF2 family DNA or RNA helicase
LTVYRDIDIDQVLRIKNASEVKFNEPPGYKSKLKRFQKKGVAFLYVAKRSACFDACGSGKTHIIMALLLLLKSRGELNRCLYLLPAADILAKVEEFAKFSNLNFAAALGPLSSRLSVYNAYYDVVFVSYEVARGRDFEYLKAMDFGTIILDESHVWRNSSTKTADVVLKLTEGAERVVTLTATPIQMSLGDMWTQSKAWHHGLFGSEHSFRRRYIVEEEVSSWRGIRRFAKKQTVGYSHVDEYKRILDPFFLRRSLADIEDELPDLVVSKHWGALLPAQRTVYEELRKGTVQLLCDGKRREARKNIHSMVMCVNSTAALGVEADYSWKLDWLMAELHRDATGFGGSMANDKVVLFAQHKSTLRVTAARLKAAGIGYVVMTGDVSKEDRQLRRKQFWEDPKCQVLMGTTAIEVSMNLHCARFLVAIDSLPNPQRVEQLVGRIRRVGSVHKTVMFVMLLTRGTFEEKLYSRLEKRQATVDKVFEEQSNIFDALDDVELLMLFSN